jgi:thiol-disulfide isomerase/thioredoxin
MHRLSRRGVAVGAGLVLIMFATVALGHAGERVRIIAMKDLNDLIQAPGFSGLVAVVASWCPPCKAELPMLSELYNQYQTKGVQIVAVSLDAGGAQAMQPLIDELKIPFPVYWVGMEAVKEFKIVGVPTTMVFKQGQLVEKRPGAQSRRYFEKTIQSLLK